MTTATQQTTEITDAQIESLQTAAGQAGDILQAAICDVALHGADAANRDYPLSDDESTRVWSMTQEQARAECARVLARHR